MRKLPLLVLHLGWHFLFIFCQLSLIRYQLLLKLHKILLNYRQITTTGIHAALYMRLSMILLLQFLDSFEQFSVGCFQTFTGSAELVYFEIEHNLSSSWLSFFLLILSKHFINFIQKIFFRLCFGVCHMLKSGQLLLGLLLYFRFWRSERLLLWQIAEKRTELFLKMPYFLSSHCFE